MKNYKLKNKRIHKKLSQAQLAEKVGISRQHIGLIENGKANPSIDVCIAICKALDITLDEIFMYE